jgi:hypothetical protein
MEFITLLLFFGLIQIGLALVLNWAYNIKKIWTHLGFCVFYISFFSWLIAREDHNAMLHHGCGLGAALMQAALIFMVFFAITVAGLHAIIDFWMEKNKEEEEEEINIL